MVHPPTKSQSSKKLINLVILSPRYWPTKDAKPAQKAPKLAIACDVTATALESSNFHSCTLTIPVQRRPGGLSS